MPFAPQAHVQPITLAWPTPAAYNECSQDSDELARDAHPLPAVVPTARSCKIPDASREHASPGGCAAVPNATPAGPSAFVIVAGDEADRQSGQATSATAHGTKVLPVDPGEHRASAYVEREGVSLQHFVNRYIRTRQRPVNRDNRLIVQQAMAQYRGGYPARAADLESFLDALLHIGAAR